MKVPERIWLVCPKPDADCKPDICDSLDYATAKAAINSIECNSLGPWTIREYVAVQVARTDEEAMR